MSTSLMPIVGTDTSSSERPGLARDFTRASITFFMRSLNVGTVLPALLAASNMPERLCVIVDGNFHYARSISNILHTVKTAARRGKPKSATAETADAINRHLGARVKQLRTTRGWSLEALANASGVSRSMLSQIERERANPTLAVTMRIARAFSMALGDLLETPGATSSVTVIRADDRAYHYRSDRNCRIRTLSPLHLEKDVE